MRALAVIAVLAAIVPVRSQAAGLERAPSPTRVPADVRTALAELSVGVASPVDIDPSLLSVRYKTALRIAQKHVGRMVRPYRSGWSRVHRIAIHLVRIVPPIPLPDHHGFVSLAPLRIGDLAWLIVMRDATIPVLGPPGGTYVAPIAVFVRTDEPAFVVAMSL
jgi:hypothetical protein